MNKIHILLKKRFSQEVLGGVLGMIVAVVLYNFSSGLMSTKTIEGSLVDISATDSVASNTASPVPTHDAATQTVIDHSDPAGWTTMRENQREIASVFDVSVQKVGAEEVQPTIAQVPPSLPATQEIASAEVLTTDTHLPNSGPMLNVTLALSLAFACFVKRRSLFAVLQLPD